MRIVYRVLYKIQQNGTKIEYPSVTKIPNVFKYMFSSRATPQNYFSKTLDKYLLTFNVVTSGILMLAGDLANQEIEFYRQVQSPKKNYRYDWQRAGQMFVVGLLLGPPQHYFYLYLDRVFPRTDVRTISKKILFDQFILSPACILIFFYGLGVLGSHNLSSINQEVKQKFYAVYKLDWIIWPGVQYINFCYLSPKYRVFYVNAITMLYDICLSYIKHEEELVSELVQFSGDVTAALGASRQKRKWICLVESIHN